ncbi:MAG: aldehyde dehydrogenase family protein [Rubellimicrobium sp.]|nr:aldehyde dehydrogenase family protein [Rubellimicrobium sp.]
MTGPPPDAKARAAAAFALQAAGRDARRLTFGLAARRKALGDLARALRDRERDIITALDADFGKPAPEVLLTEILPVAHEIRHARRNLARWMRARRARPTLALLGTRARIEMQPKGTCLIIAPWNYPLNLCLGPLVSCLAAGNAAVLKPSELTPTTSALVARIVAEVFDPALVTVCEGGREMAEALLDQPFDHVFFTGGTTVGRAVMARAAQHPTPVTLELGGKSPCIVGPGADVAAAARWITFGKFANAGQTCIAPDHVLVHDSQRAALVAALRASVVAAYGTGAASPNLARIVTDTHAVRLADWLAEAQAGGARTTGPPPAGRAVPPLIVEDAPPESHLMQEEIFGPLLPVESWSDEGALVARLNGGPVPLSLYVFDRDRIFARRVIAATSSGSAGVNLTVAQFSHPGLPFGGMGASGFGVAHGEHGFRTFSHERAVLENRFSPLPLLFAPWRRTTRRLIEWAARWGG